MKHHERSGTYGMFVLSDRRHVQQKGFTAQSSTSPRFGHVYPLLGAAEMIRKWLSFIYPPWVLDCSDVKRENMNPCQSLPYSEFALVKCIYGIKKASANRFKVKPLNAKKDQKANNPHQPTTHHAILTIPFCGVN